MLFASNPFIVLIVVDKSRNVSQKLEFPKAPSVVFKEV